MKKITIIIVFILFWLITFIVNVNAQSMDKTVRVGGEAMLPSRNIVENAVNSKSHTTLVAAVQAAGLVPTLQEKGPFTVFAPVNDAFENLPEGTVDKLLMPENKKSLASVLTYHVVSGRITYNDLMGSIKKGKGSYSTKTVNGGELTFSMNGAHNIMITDENGNGSNISVYDVLQSNGVIHVIDAVMLPK